MTKTLPSYLRLHSDSRGDSEGKDPQAVTSESSAAKSSTDSVEQFWLDFSETTGWRLDKRAARREGVSNVLPAVEQVTMGRVEVEPAAHETAQDEQASTDELPTALVGGIGRSLSESIATVSKSAATLLAKSAARLAEELRVNRETLRRQEAELAARAAIITGEDERANLANRIEVILSDAVTACDCDAAAIYLLDDDTQYLKARAAFGLSIQTLEHPPRELRGSRGDLEAMVRGVVTIDNFQSDLVETWNNPEPSFQAGICAVIRSADVPIGTIWIFRNETAQFGNAECAAARLAATAISIELSSASVVRRKKMDRRADTSVRDIAQWQHETMPVGARLAQDWRADGMIESPRDWATGWHTWDILPDGSLMIAIAEAVDKTIVGALNATVARSALASHVGYRHTPGQLLSRVSDTLWQTSTGEQLVSLLYARIDPETGEGEVASAGSITAMIGNRYGYRPLIDGRSEPLNSHIDARCVSGMFRMMEGETLLAYTAGVTLDGASQTKLGDWIRTSMQQQATDPLAQVRRQMASLDLKHERGALTLLRS